jgi:YidC/Oxa1 family membrane protein insertase
VINAIARVLLEWMELLRGWAGSYGWAIILLTLLVKLALHPLTRTQLKSMKAMQALAPQIQVLREKYRGNPQQMNIEMMNLYKAYRVNPLGGCLPMIVQLPILYGLFAALNRPNVFGGEQFLGAGLEQHPTLNAVLENPLLALYPLLVGLTTYLQQRMSVTDPQQARLFIIFPFMITYFAMQFPVGLSLYWIVSTFLYIVEYFIIVGSPKSPAGAPAAPHPNPVLPQRPKGVKKK